MKQQKNIKFLNSIQKIFKNFKPKRLKQVEKSKQIIIIIL